MFLWVVLLSAHSCWGLGGAAAGGATAAVAAAAAAAADSTGLERIEKCSTRCSQGLQCRSRADYLFRQCQEAGQGLNASSVFRNVSLSTVMSCEGKHKCLLHLRVTATIHLTEWVYGVSICTVSAGMMTSCRTVSFTRVSRERLSGLQVEVQNDCALVAADQRLQVVLNTVPSYCGVAWTGAYTAPACTSEDLRRHVPECITGRLSYHVDEQRKELSVRVSEMLEEHDYFLRLCYKDFICSGAGSDALIKKEELAKSVTLAYARPLPCLCIEGWSAVMDAPRVQVCPFQDRLEELWSQVTFDPLEETLSWELACRVPTVVSLCQRMEGGGCADLPDASRNVSRGKIFFADVDPHPHLCMKFTVGSQSWTRCPFPDGRLQAWDVTMGGHRGHEAVTITSRVNATFSLGLCERLSDSRRAAAGACHAHTMQSVHVGKNQAVAALNLTEDLCRPCVQVRRLHVKYAAAVILCVERCNQPETLTIARTHKSTWDPMQLVAPLTICLSSLIIILLLLHVALTVYQRRSKQTGDANQKQMESDRGRVVPASCPHRGILVPDSPSCGNMEKTNLISERDKGRW